MNLVDCKSALKTLKTGLPIIFPTDTLPAIGCLPKFSNIIYEFKKRDKNKPIRAITGNNLISRTYSKKDAMGSNIQ